MRVVLLLLIAPLLACSQRKNEVDYGGQFHLNLGTEYRITPIYNVNVLGLSDSAFFTNLDRQNSGFSFKIGLELFVIKNFSIGLVGSLRYDLLVNEPPDSIDDFSQTVGERRLMLGYHLNLSYYFKLFRKGEAFIGGGISLLNRNSDYTTQEVFFDEVGNITRTETRTGNYKFSANKLLIGYNIKRSKICLGIYLTRESPYFQESPTFIIPFIGYNYNIAKF
ncbi:hypothetical protein [Ulvibacterium sp.]|uniref:hypothetical protein n=1 Tax=Ulvibacterium sp. TaxID=2665914 RepID=UPI00260F63DB|nr:hypothetical protein [Ulvibacterium sp.]